MKIKSKIPAIIVAALAWIVIISSCANQGMPTGGPRDSIPPILLGTQPKIKALNFNGDFVRLTFNEYIDPSQVSEDLVISPPLEKRPVIRTKSKSLIVQFNEELLDSTTYSLDFKNSVSDNNERNPYKNLRFSFSTGSVYDSLRVAGRVLNAYNLEPLEKGLVLLQKNLHDSAVYKVRPNYIAKTDDSGLFLIDNIAPGDYNIFSINDANNDMLYNEGAEEISFLDELIIPSAQFEEELDTLVKGVDSLLILGHTHFLPEPVYLRVFTEDIFEQYLDSYDRNTRNKCSFIFNESVKDTFGVKLIGEEETNWYLLEYNEEMDSLVMWITDTIVSKADTLLMELSYFQLDSMSQIYIQKDTLELNFKDIETEASKRKKKPKEEEEEEKIKPIPQFNWQTNMGSSAFDLNNNIRITSPDPVKHFDSTMVNLFLKDDTLKTPLKFRFEKDTSAWRSYKISYKWESETEYTLEIDSAACENIYGITSKKVSKKFKTRPQDYYGTIILKLTGVNSPLIIQLLENNDNENVLLQDTISVDKVLVFSFLAPDKYKVKAIYDDNKNGKWDSGSFQDKIQPEKVAYINEVQKVKSNWDVELPWDLIPDLTFYKNVRDLELEEQKRKEAEEKARQEKEGNLNQGGQQNNMFQQGGNSSGAGTQIRR